MGRRATVTGVGMYVPPKILTNKDLEKMVDTSDEWITTRTGIKERRIAADDVPTSELALKAARKALADADLKAEELDLIMVATVTPDMSFPSTACILQEKLGADKAAAFDMEAGCSGFVYAMSVASQFIETGMYDNILIIGAETLSKITDWEDRSTCVLFGDGAGAAVLQPTENGGILATELGADGTGGKSLFMPAGGSLNPADKTTVEEKMHYIKMEGNQVFKFAVKKMGQASLDVIKKAGLNPDDVDLFVPHQANIRIIDAAAKRLNLTKDRVFVNLPKYGNTSAASVPIALAEAKEEGLINNGDIIVLVAFGAGLTWASAIIKWDEGEN
ncbi:beta-ketoacyl-ACP synthase III [Halothermothrix orenii]|uniref:Beta-ketoacyl-[acyl-carrier-protein] synthase III n=1 Tax=Halothermothrix orenii (strain H 168 / OCM 544 / DSM 9562) TaxID=373903 RepID=B8CWW3_HALOH|nr:beta-ketoacyl-ACP synthase III [Halothermothrix orenii]ACL69782.1 3-oxoacyl-(acyl-carrier-protein) synthase III [Halothermothrix orenii H 168]